MATVVNEQKRPHGLSLSDRASLQMTGVEEVERFDDSEIVMYTTRGKLTVQGHELRISKYSVDSGDLSIEGTVNALGYSGEERGKGGFWARMFG